MGLPFLSGDQQPHLLSVPLYKGASFTYAGVSENQIKKICLESLWKV